MGNTFKKCATQVQQEKHAQCNLAFCFPPLKERFLVCNHCIPKTEKALTLTGNVYSLYYKCSQCANTLGHGKVMVKVSVIPKDKRLKKNKVAL